MPTGPFSIGTWIDDAGDTGEATLTPETPWSIAATGGNLGPQVYLTGTYGNNLCVSLTTPSMMLAAGSTLAFWSKYQIESELGQGRRGDLERRRRELGDGTGELPRDLIQHR